MATTARRDAGLASWQIIWRDRVEKARGLAALGRGEARDDWNFSADEILAVEADRVAKADLWARQGDRADALERVLAKASRLAIDVTWAARLTDPSAWWDSVESSARAFIKAEQGLEKRQSGDPK